MSLLTKLALLIDLAEGDIVLGGKFKNKRMEVEELGTDELGQPTVNGQKLLAVRIEKKLPDDMKSSKTKEEMDKEAATKFIKYLKKINYKGIGKDLEKSFSSKGKDLQSRIGVSSSRRDFVQDSKKFYDAPSIDEMITHREKLPKMNRPISLVPRQFGGGRSIKAMDMNRESVGRITIPSGPQGYIQDTVSVDSNMKRRGIATALHRKAKALGYNMVESSHYTPEGAALTKKLSEQKIVGFNIK